MYRSNACSGCLITTWLRASCAHTCHQAWFGSGHWLVMQARRVTAGLVEIKATQYSVYEKCYLWADCQELDQLQHQYLFMSMKLPLPFFNKLFWYISTQTFCPWVLWHCRLGYAACKNVPNELLCVGWEVTHFDNSDSNVSMWVSKKNDYSVKSMLLFCAVVKGKSQKLEDVLGILASGFLRGGTGGFLKGSAAGEMIKGSGNVNRDIRVGVTHVSHQLFPFFIRARVAALLEIVLFVFLAIVCSTALFHVVVTAWVRLLKKHVTGVLVLALFAIFLENCSWQISNRGSNFVRHHQIHSPSHRHVSTIGDRMFPVSAACVWNRLRHTSHRRRRYMSSKGIGKQSSSLGVFPSPHHNKLNHVTIALALHDVKFCYVPWPNS